MKVLILDKKLEEIEKLHQGLEGQDFEVIEAESIEKGLEDLNELRPEIIIADFQLPEFEGVELVNSILAQDLEDYPYVIFVTEDAHEKKVIECLGPIPGDFLTRPIKDNELQARLAIAERTIQLQARLRDTASHSESLALYDQLTSVLNRQAIYERALAELNRAQREDIQVGLAMIEVVNLEEVQEAYGPNVRDQAIRFVARATRANVRIYDIVGRWIGAKFMLMLPGITKENAAAIFNRIHTAVTTIRVRVPDGDRLTLNIRIGFTVTDNENPLPLYMLIEQINKALEKAMKSEENEVLAFEDIAEEEDTEPAEGG